jgi:hypothetical protein
VLQAGGYLYDTGNYDAMYLAGLIADDARMTKKDLRRWVGKAYAGALPGATVAWVAAGSPHGHELASGWIESSKSLVAAAGWATTSSPNIGDQRACPGSVLCAVCATHIRSGFDLASDHTLQDFWTFLAIAPDEPRPTGHQGVVFPSRHPQLSAHRRCRQSFSAKP